MTQKCKFKKYIGKVKCPQCGDNGYLELWATEPPYMPVFRVVHKIYFGRYKTKNSIATNKTNSIRKTIKVCWLLNEQAEQLFSNHKKEYQLPHIINHIKSGTCHICDIYTIHGLITPHEVAING